MAPEVTAQSSHQHRSHACRRPQDVASEAIQHDRWWRSRNDVDVPLTKMLEGRRAVQEELMDDKDISAYQAIYAKDLKSLVERAKNGDDQALMQLQLYQQLRNSIRDLRKKREPSK